MIEFKIYLNILLLEAKTKLKRGVGSVTIISKIENMITLIIIRKIILVIIMVVAIRDLTEGEMLLTGVENQVEIGTTEEEVAGKMNFVDLGKLNQLIYYICLMKCFKGAP